jgi:hypothetical protein
MAIAICLIGSIPGLQNSKNYHWPVSFKLRASYFSLAALRTTPTGRVVLDLLLVSLPEHQRKGFLNQFKTLASTDRGWSLSSLSSLSGRSILLEHAVNLFLISVTAIVEANGLFKTASCHCSSLGYLRSVTGPAQEKERH